MSYLSLRAQLSYFDAQANHHEHQLRDLSRFTGYLGRVSYADTQSLTPEAMLQHLIETSVTAGQQVLAVALDGQIYRFEANHSLTRLSYPAVPEPGNVVIEQAGHLPARIWQIAHLTATCISWQLFS